MAVVTRNRVTTITPTAWRWYAGAAALLALSAWAGELSIVQFAFAGGLMAMGSGYLYRMVLTPEGFSYTLGPIRKNYPWARVIKFKVNAMRYGLFNVMHQIAFTDTAKAETFGGKFAKLLSVGTDAMPVYGIDPSRLLGMMTDYQLSRLPGDTPAEAPRQPRQPAAAPQANRPQPRTGVPAPRPVPSSRPPVAATPAIRSRIQPGQDPLVQDSASRRRATRNAPLG